MNSGAKISALDPHQHYKELCAVAGAGQLSESEAVELNEHLKGCEDCRDLVRNFAFLCVQVLPVITTAEPLPPGMTERFIARARSEGIAISDAAKDAIVPKTKESPPRNVWKTAFWGAVAASLIIGGILVWMVREGWQSSSARVVANRAQPSVGPGSSGKSPSGPEPTVKSGVEPEIQALEAQLRSKEARLATVRKDLKQRQRELEAISRQKSNDESVRERLLGARNLHVIRVRSTDERGDPMREFGRVFYLEGKRLEFYAFDLDDPKSRNTNRAFYLWGEPRDTAKNGDRIIPLGRFSFDSTEDNRWALVVSDPRALASLRVVFVTSESTEHPVIGPTGKRTLFVSLEQLE